MRKNEKDAVESLAIAASLNDSEETLHKVMSSHRRASDEIARLKTRLVGLHRQRDAGPQLFRLSYSILTLEACLRERAMMDLCVDQSPGIRAVVRRIDAELDTLWRDTEATTRVISVDTTPLSPVGTEADLSGLYAALAHLSDLVAALPRSISPSPDGSELVRLLADMQKTVAADGRRNYASLAALHAAIERLSERLEQVEHRIMPHPDADRPDRKAEGKALTPAGERERIDPRPMLIAARAAAARALTDLAQNTPSAHAVLQPQMPIDEPNRAGKPAASQPRRRWSFSFAAA